MRLIDADALLNDSSIVYHTEFGDAVVDVEDIEKAPTMAMFYGKREQEWHQLKWEDEETKCKLLDYPFDGKWVIVTDGKNISVERIKRDAIDHFYPAGRWFNLEDVVAWMPLPEPYEGEGEAE